MSSEKTAHRSCCLASVFHVSLFSFALRRSRLTRQSVISHASARLEVCIYTSRLYLLASTLKSSAPTSNSSAALRIFFFHPQNLPDPSRIELPSLQLQFRSSSQRVVDGCRACVLKVTFGASVLIHLHWSTLFDSLF